MSNARGRLRVASYNVSTLPRRLHNVLLTCLSLSIDLLCLQEVRVSADSFAATRSICEAYGYQVFFTAACLNSADQITGGLAVLVRVHAQSCSHMKGPLRDVYFICLVLSG